MVSDWHTHTVYSHGKGRIEDNVRAAAEKKLKTVGIADHGPGHAGFGLSRKNIPIMRAEVEQLSVAYPEIEILLGVEANIVNRSGELDILPDEYSLFDFVIAGYHYGVIGESLLTMLKTVGVNFCCDKLGGKSRNQETINTEMIINAVRNNNIFMVTHPGDKGPVDIQAVAEACRAKGTLFEISALHDCLSMQELRTAAATGVRFAVSSDAHKPERVGAFEPAVERALKAGIDLSQIVNIILISG